MKLIIIGWVVFSSFSWSSAEMFLETFEDEDLENWQEVNMQNLDGGTFWNVSDGELQGMNRNPLMSLLIAKDKIWHDYSIQFDVKPLKKHGSSNIIIAVRQQKNWGVLCIVGNLLPGFESRTTCLSGDLNGNFILIKEAPHKFLPLNKWSTLKLSVHGDLVTFWINGKQILDTMVLEPVDGFPDFVSGSAGFGLTNCDAKFDNIRIGEFGNLSVLPRAKLPAIWGILKQF